MMQKLYHGLIGQFKLILGVKFGEIGFDETTQAVIKVDLTANLINHIKVSNVIKRAYMSNIFKSH